MWIVTRGVLFVGGVLATAGWCVARKPDAKELIAKLAPYQGLIGALMFLCGIYDFIQVLRIMSVIKAIPVAWTIGLVTSVTELLLGPLLVFGLINKYAHSRSPEAENKGDVIRAKLVKFQGPLGIIAIIGAILWVLVNLGILVM